MENPEPLSKDIYLRAVKAGITAIALRFSGGSDEGHLYVQLYLRKGVPTSEHEELESDVESWAWDTYTYGGAGDGSEYGDDITYDLEKHTVTTSDWCMTRREGDSSTRQMHIHE